MKRIDDLPQAVREAIEWLALQGSGSMDEAQREHFAHWLQADESHRQAWQGLQRRLHKALSPLDRGASAQALTHTGRQRRQLLRGALGLAGVGLSLGWLEQHGLLPALSGQDLRTARGERRHIELEDGSQLLLNARSRVLVAFNEHQRLLELREGALNLRVATDLRRPMVVRTGFGEVHALGTRFGVSLQAHEAHLWVQRHSVRLLAGTETLLLSSGEGAAFDQKGIRRLPAQRYGESAWEDGQLEIHDQPLSVLIDALRPYHAGPLHLDAEAATLRVSGMFPLDDSERALRSLQQVLPVQIEQRFGWWTRVRHNG